MSIHWTPTTTRRDALLGSPSDTHGGGRKPEPEFTVNPAELLAWTAANSRARASYRARMRWVAEHDRRERAWDRYEATL